MAGRYEFGDFIASGGMAEVWRARDNDYSRDVAIKLLKPEYADDPASRVRFDAEARHVQSIHHPNVAAVYDVGEMPTASGLIRPYLTMEYVAGRPLSAIIADGPLAPERVQSLLAQAGEGLAAAHAAGIVHRDVKPANLLVTDDGTLKITDFGIARSASQGAVTVTGQVVGTPQYLSPEQARGEVATPASDVYGLGVVAYEALTGSRPFDRPTAVATALAHLEDPVPDLPPDIPAGLAAVVQRSLAKDPSQRYANGGDFAEAMRSAAVAAPEVTAVVPQQISASADLPTQALDAVDLPVREEPVVEPRPTTFVPATEAPVAKAVDPLAPQRAAAGGAAVAAGSAAAAAATSADAVEAARLDGATHARTTVVRLPKSMQPMATAVTRKTSSWPFGTLDTVLVFLGALTILALGWVAYFISSSAPAAPTSSTTTRPTVHAKPTPSTTTSAPTTVDMTCGPVTAGGKYLKGRQIDEVTAILTGIGVKVHANPESGPSYLDNQVSRVTPCRGVHQGDTVQVYYYSSDLSTSSSNPTDGASATDSSSASDSSSPTATTPTSGATP